MTEAETALASRAVACKGWLWMPGMRWWTDDDRGRLDDFQPEYMGRPTFALPDLPDPATLGCLLARVREARQEPTGFVVPTHGEGWSYYTRLNAADWFTGNTEAESLVLALENAL